MSSGGHGKLRRSKLVKGEKGREVRKLTTNTMGCSAWREVDRDVDGGERIGSVAGIEDGEEEVAAEGSGST